MKSRTVRVVVEVGGGPEPILIDVEPGSFDLTNADLLTIRLDGVPWILEAAGRPVRLKLRGKWYEVGKEVVG